MRIPPQVEGGGNVSALAAAAVSGAKPSGRALPSLIVGSPSSPAELVRSARAASPLASLINLALPMRIKNLLSPHLSDPVGAVERRARSLMTFRDVDWKLSPYRKSWTYRLDPKSPARNINLSLLHLLVKRFDYPDCEIANELMNGMPIAGDIPSRPGLQPRDRPALLPMTDWAGNLAERNKKAIQRAQRFRETDLGAELWRKSLLEVDDGWLSHPIPLSGTLAVTANLTPRYAIREQHGDGPRKVRIVDDLRASCVNSATTTRDAAVPDSLNVFIAITSYYRLIRPGCDLLVASSDFCHAYKNVAIPRDDGLFPSVLLGPPTGPLLVAQLSVQPFGSTRAPANWGRVAKLIQWVLLT